MSGRSWCASPPRRSGTRDTSLRVRSCFGCLLPRHQTAGPSCREGSAVSPINPMRAPCLWVRAPERPTSGWCRRRKSPPRHCCRPAIPFASSASPGGCLAAQRTICSGSAAIWNARKLRCGWCAGWVARCANLARARRRCSR